MARISELHKRWMKEPKYRKAYEALEEEFVLASAVIDVRNRAGLTQAELARKMGATQPVVAGWKAGVLDPRCAPWKDSRTPQARACSSASLRAPRNGRLGEFAEYC